MARRILYIEDNTDNRMLVKRILSAEGYILEEASNAKDGIRMATQNPPDLILMDISMPDMDGLTATQELRAMPALDHVPIIAVTANVMKGDREETLRAGCDAYIPKPIDVDRFSEQINQYMNIRRSAR